MFILYNEFSHFKQFYHFTNAFLSPLKTTCTTFNPLPHKTLHMCWTSKKYDAKILTGHARGKHRVHASRQNGSCVFVHCTVMGHYSCLADIIYAWFWFPIGQGCGMMLFGIQRGIWSSSHPPHLFSSTFSWHASQHWQLLVACLSTVTTSLGILVRHWQASRIIWRVNTTQFAKVNTLFYPFFSHVTFESLHITSSFYNLKTHLTYVYCLQHLDL